MKTLTQTFLAVATVIVLAGCSGGSKGLSVSASTAATPPGGTARASIDAGNGLTIDRLRLVVRKVEVEGGEDGAACPLAPPPPPAETPATPAAPQTSVVPGDHSGSGSSGSGSSGDDDGMDDDEGECEIEAGPFLVDLSGEALSAGVHWVAAVDVPAGTWHEVKFVINTINAEKANGDAGLLEMVDAHASILVDGTRDGAPFTFSLPLEVKQSREGAIVVDPATGANVTLDIDPSGWFKAADGSRLDPEDPTAQGAIIRNVKASIRVLHDDDGDGHDDEDHGMGGHDDSPGGGMAGMP
jgi:hypothetical protein